MNKTEAFLVFIIDLLVLQMEKDGYKIKEAKEIQKKAHKIITLPDETNTPGSESKKSFEDSF